MVNYIIKKDNLGILVVKKTGNMCLTKIFYQMLQSIEIEPTLFELIKNQKAFGQFQFK